MADQDVRANNRRLRHSLPRAVDGAGSISAPGSCPRARAAGKRGKHMIRWMVLSQGPPVWSRKETTKAVQAGALFFIWRGSNKPVPRWAIDSTVAGKLGLSRCLCSFSFFTSSFTHLGRFSATRWLTSATRDMRFIMHIWHRDPCLCWKMTAAVLLVEYIIGGEAYSD